MVQRFGKSVFRFRLLWLGGVNALIAGHIYLWYVRSNHAVGCVDFFGWTTFAGSGVVTAGTVFLGVLAVLTLVLGRVFCGWGCHFAFFQDGLMRVLRRIGVRPVFRRSRLERILPPVLVVVTLLAPVVVHWRRVGLPDEVSVNLGYPDVWHILPGVKGVLLMLFVDVVVLTALFGSRAFCRLVCPYGLSLKFLHVASPLRVVPAGTCTDCGECTKSCPTGVAIQHEIRSAGSVYDLGCMNCGDCVAACSAQALALRPTRLAYRNAFRRVRPRFTLTRRSDALLVISALSGLLLFRGHEYGDFLAVAMGIGVGALILIAHSPERLVRPRAVFRLGRSRVRAAALALSIYFGLGVVGQAFTRHACARIQACLTAENAEGALHWTHRVERASQVLRPTTFYLANFSGRRRSIARACYDAARKAMEHGKWTDARNYYRAVLELMPGRGQTWGDVGTT